MAKRPRESYLTTCFELKSQARGKPFVFDETSTQHRVSRVFQKRQTLWETSRAHQNTREVLMSTWKTGRAAGAIKCIPCRYISLSHPPAFLRFSGRPMSIFNSTTEASKVSRFLFRRRITKKSNLLDWSGSVMGGLRLVLQSTEYRVSGNRTQLIFFKEYLINEILWLKGYSQQANRAFLK